MTPVTVPCPHCQAPVAVAVEQVGRCHGLRRRRCRVNVERIEGPARQARHSIRQRTRRRRRGGFRETFCLSSSLFLLLHYFTFHHFKSLQDRDE